MVGIRCRNQVCRVKACAIHRIAGATRWLVHPPYASPKGPDARDAARTLPAYGPRMMTKTKYLTVCAETRCGITTLSKHEANCCKAQAGRRRGSASWREATQALSRKIETTPSSPFLAGDAQKNKAPVSHAGRPGLCRAAGGRGMGGTRPAQDQREAVRLGSGIGQSFLGQGVQVLPASFRVAGPASRTRENPNGSQDPGAWGARRCR